MITNEKHLLYILSVNKEQLNYLLTHLEDYYCSFEKVKINSQVNQRRIVMAKLSQDKSTYLKEN